MNISAIVYTSNTGFTARYATMLAQRTGLPCHEAKDAAQLPQGAPVLYLGWLCAGKIKGLQEAMARFDVQAVCAVGLTLPQLAEPEEMAKQNKLGDRPFFYLPGGYDPKKVKGVYRFMMGMVRRGLRKNAGSPLVKHLLHAIQNGGDWVSEEALGPVLAWLEG